MESKWLVVIARHFRDGDTIEAYDTEDAARAALASHLADEDSDPANYEAQVYLCQIVESSTIPSHY